MVDTVSHLPIDIGDPSSTQDDGTFHLVSLLHELPRMTTLTSESSVLSSAVPTKMAAWTWTLRTDMIGLRKEPMIQV